MRFNTYRQYKTLNNVKRESKRDILNKLTPRVKNILRYLPKSEYEKFVKGGEKVIYRMAVYADNRIDSFLLMIFNAAGNKIIKQKTIPIPKLCYYTGQTDGSLIDDKTLLNVRYYTAANQILKFNAYQLSTAQHSDNLEETDIQSIYPVYETEENFQQTTRDGSPTGTWINIIPKTLSYELIDFDVTGVGYDLMPALNIKYFE